MAQVMIVEDDEAYAYVIEKRVIAAGHVVIRFDDWTAALAALESSAVIDLLVTDLRLPPGTPNGVSLGRMARLRRPNMPIIYMTAFAETAVAASGAIPAVLLKSADAGNVMRAIETALVA